MTYNIDITSLHEVLTNKLSLYHLTAATPSALSEEEIKRPPLLTAESLPLLQYFYLSAVRRVCKRLCAWICDLAISETEISISFSDSLFAPPSADGYPESTPLFSLLTQSIGEACESFVLAEVYAENHPELSTRFRTRSEELLDSIVEMFALFN